MPALLGSVVVLLGLVVPLGAVALADALSGRRLVAAVAALVLSCGALVVGCSLVARRGVWTSDDGVRIHRLLRHETVPWSQVAVVGVAPMRHSLGRRLWCATIEIDAGEHRIALPASSNLAAWLLRSSPPRRVRHTLSREHRYHLARSLPRRQPGTPASADGGVLVYTLDLRDPETGAVVDLRTTSKAKAPNGDGPGDDSGRIVTIDLRDPRTGEVADLRAPMQPGPGEPRRSVPPSRL